MFWPIILIPHIYWLSLARVFRTDYSPPLVGLLDPTRAWARACVWVREGIPVQGEDTHGPRE